jgi:hypothetical protein
MRAFLANARATFRGARADGGGAPRGRRGGGLCVAPWGRGAVGYAGLRTAVGIAAIRAPGAALNSGISDSRNVGFDSEKVPHRQIRCLDRMSACGLDERIRRSD